MSYVAESSFFNQNGEARKKSSGLVSHFSLPKTSNEMAAVENFLHFQQETTIPCQVRAKRGFATHPRSIAERVNFLHSQNRKSPFFSVHSLMI